MTVSIEKLVVGKASLRSSGFSGIGAGVIRVSDSEAKAKMLCHSRKEWMMCIF